MRLMARVWSNESAWALTLLAEKQFLAFVRLLLFPAVSGLHARAA